MRRAIQTGNLQEVERLYLKGEYDVRDCFISAFCWERVEVAEFFLQAGVNPNEEMHGYNILQYNVLNLPTIKLLLAYGFDPSIQCFLSVDPCITWLVCDGVFLQAERMEALDVLLPYFSQSHLTVGLHSTYQDGVDNPEVQRCLVRHGALLTLGEHTILQCVWGKSKYYIHKVYLLMTLVIRQPRLKDIWRLLSHYL